MNQDLSSHANRKSLVKRWLPYLIIATVVVNSPLIMVPIDAVLILVHSIASILGQESLTNDTLATVRAQQPMLRNYGNILIFLGLIIISLRGSQERK